MLLFVDLESPANLSYGFNASVLPYPNAMPIPQPCGGGGLYPQLGGFVPPAPVPFTGIPALPNSSSTLPSGGGAPYFPPTPQQQQSSGEPAAVQGIPELPCEAIVVPPEEMVFTVSLLFMIFPGPSN